MAGRTTRASELGLVAVTIEGGLIAPEQVQKIASAERNAKLAASYESPKGTNLGDEIARYFRIGQALWKDYSAISSPTVTRTAEFAHDLLKQCFGFDDLVGPIDHERGNRRYRIAREARQGRVPIVVAPPASDRDAFNVALPEFGDGAAGSRQRRSPVSLLQDWLNASPSFYWGLVFAGDRVRLMRDNDSLTRPAWIEADLGEMFGNDMFADFTIWWLLTHATRFGAAHAPASHCALEDWRAEGLKQGTAAREMLRGGVETALAELGQGVIEANPELRDRLQDQGALTGLFEELLRTVYRLIFLAVAEDRDLLHPRRTGQEARALYAGNYSFGFWRERSRRRVARDKHHDAWEAMKITFASLERGEELLGLPALGGLFAGGATPALTAAKISNRRFLEAMFNLGFLVRNKVTHRINWRDLKTEELGSVYESLLEIRPRLTPAGQFELDAGAKGNARKTSGSYYTPESLVETLLDSALDPVLNQAETSADTPDEKVAALLDLRIIDPACGSGHFLLGAARRMADRVAKLRNEDAGKAETQAALRDVVSRCIHGVDRNPMAVELAKVALWIESVSPGQPLGFLDANIRCGDALLGVFDLDALDEGIPDAAYKPLASDDKAAAKYYLQQNKAAKKGQGQFDWAGGTGAMPPRKLAANFSTIRRMPEDTVRQVEKKRAAYEAWRRDPARCATRVACDLYIAAFLLPKTEVPLNNGRNMVPTTAEVRAKLGGEQVYGPLEAVAVNAAGEARVLHWPLAFPDVMVERGGFDVVLGNPPWDQIEADPDQFFDEIVPEVVSAKNKAEKDRIIESLQSTRSELFSEFQQFQREVWSLQKFVHESGRFPTSSFGRLNLSSLFIELTLELGKLSGRGGLVVPAGVVSDQFSKPLFDKMMQEEKLVSFYAFENEEKLFDGVANVVRFALLTLGEEKGSKASFAFYLRKASDLDNENVKFELNAHDIAELNPAGGSCPVFRSERDFSLTKTISKRVQNFGHQDTKLAWGHDYMLMFMMNDASKSFQVVEGRASGIQILNGDVYFPLYEGKFISHFDHRFGSYALAGIEKGKGGRGLPHTPQYCYDDPNYEITPRYWISAKLVEARLNGRWNRDWMIAWRDVTSAKLERTVVACAIPRSGVGHTAALLFVDQSPAHAAGLLGNLNSLVLDFVARQKVAGTHLTFGYMNQLPLLAPSAYSKEDLGFIVPRVLELNFTSFSMASFARDLGHNGAPFDWDEDRRAQLRAELDAWYALAYDLTRDELRYVLDPKDVMGADYPSETFRVLQKNEIAKYGEYRTRRLVLAAYDAMISDGHRSRAKGYR